MVAKDDGRLRLDASPAQASCDGFRLLYVLLCFRYVVSIQYLTVIRFLEGAEIRCCMHGFPILVRAFMTVQLGLPSSTSSVLPMAPRGRIK